jgi:uncharacterized membrane protein
MTKTKLFIILFMVACVGISVVFAQRYSNRRYSYRRGVPDWEPDKEFSQEVDMEAGLVADLVAASEVITGVVTVAALAAVTGQRTTLTAI